MEDEFIEKLKEKYEKGEISRETYEDILARYEKEKLQDITNEDGIKEKERTIEEKENYKCAGSCTLGPGKYEHISVAGSLKVSGDIEVDTLSVAGSFKGEGDVKADSFKVAGSASLEGSIKADRINIAGSFTCREIEGDTVKIAGGLTAERVTGDRITIGGQVKCEEIRANTLEMKISKESSVGTINAERIEIKSERGFFSGCRGKLNATKIIGEQVYIECTTVDYVEGEKVVIGLGCTVRKVKARNYKVAKNSRVKEVIRE